MVSTQPREKQPRCEDATGKKGDLNKVPHTAYCASASLQRGKDFPAASEGRSVKDAVPGQEDGNDQGEGREDAVKSKEKEVKTAVLHTMWML